MGGGGAGKGRGAMVTTMESLREAKAGLRERMRGAVRNVDAPGWAEASSAVCASVLLLEAYRNARVVMMYHPTSRELSLRSVGEACWRTGRRVCLPRAEWTTGVLHVHSIRGWEEGLGEPRRGIREPVATLAGVPYGEIDLVLVPGVAFDSRGGRIGRGAGFYDRFLSLVRAVKVGVCLDAQVVDEVPMGEGDVRLDWVVTPTRVFQRAG